MLARFLVTLGISREVVCCVWGLGLSDATVPFTRLVLSANEITVNGLWWILTLGLYIAQKLHAVTSFHKTNHKTPWESNTDWRSDQWLLSNQVATVSKIYYFRSWYAYINLQREDGSVPGAGIALVHRGHMALTAYRGNWSRWGASGPVEQLSNVERRTKSKQRCWKQQRQQQQRKIQRNTNLWSKMFCNNYLETRLLRAVGIIPFF